MKITKLVRNVRDKRKISIYVDSKYTFSVLESIVVKYNLFSGKEISEEEIIEIKEKGNLAYWKDKALGQIARRPRSKKEIEEYLQKKNQIELVLLIIPELEKEGHLDDQKFTAWWIDQRLTFKNKSIKEIQTELYKKGIEKDLIEIEIGKLDTEKIEKEKVKSLAEKKIVEIKRKTKEETEIREKLIQYLQRKGFRWDVIKSALAELEI